MGKTPTTFDPYANITRYQVITMVVRAADNLKPGLLSSPPSGFTPTAPGATTPPTGLTPPGPNTTVFSWGSTSPSSTRSAT